MGAGKAACATEWAAQAGLWMLSLGIARQLGLADRVVGAPE